MTASRAPGNPTVTEFDATVGSVDGRQVVLAETYFYAESGGQPADRGIIAGVTVDDVQSVDGEVVHVLASEPPVEAGETVSCTVDPAFRTYCMRAHTASHVLYGAARRLFDQLGYGGFDIGTDKVRVDLETGSDLGDEELVELERLSNRVVWDGLPVTWEEVPVEEAHERAEIAFNTKTEEGVMTDAETVRVVTIEGWDTAACGGTHVSSTETIGPIEVLDRSNPGEGLTRVEFAVGPTGVDRDAQVHGAALEAARSLGCAIEDLPDEIDRIQSAQAELEATLRDRTREVVAASLAGFDRLDRNGATWAVGAIEGVDANEVRGPLEEFVGDDRDDQSVVCASPSPDIAVVVGGDESPFVVVASAGAVDAGDVVDDVTTEFGGGGGGGPTFAQGGGLSCEPDEVLTWLRNAGGN